VPYRNDSVPEVQYTRGKDAPLHPVLEPDQEDLRRRLRAARVLRDITVQQLAELIPSESRLGERTLRKLESGETQLTPPLMRELAVALTVPYEWFTVPDLPRAVAEPDPSMADRVRALERAQEQLWELARATPEARPGAVRQSPPAADDATSGAARPRSPRRPR
jgi:transcriptional regulator with XRE-family HTH domain